MDGKVQDTKASVLGEKHVSEYALWIVQLIPASCFLDPIRKESHRKGEHMDKLPGEGNGRDRAFVLLPKGARS